MKQMIALFIFLFMYSCIAMEQTETTSEASETTEKQSEVICLRSARAIKNKLYKGGFANFVYRTRIDKKLHQQIVNTDHLESIIEGELDNYANMFHKKSVAKIIRGHKDRIVGIVKKARRYSVTLHSDPYNPYKLLDA